MHAATTVSAAVWWREKVVELPEVANRTADPDLRRRLFDLADQWDELADELDKCGELGWLPLAAAVVDAGSAGLALMATTRQALA